MRATASWWMWHQPEKSLGGVTPTRIAGRRGGGAGLPRGGAGLPRGSAGQPRGGAGAARDGPALRGAASRRGTGAAALRAYWSDDFLERRTVARGRLINAALTALTASIPGTTIKVRGRGMAHGLDFGDEELARKVASTAFGFGLLVETAGLRGEVVKLMPPLTITDDELDTGLSMIADSVHAVC